MSLDPKPTLTGAAVKLRNLESRDVADRLASGFDPAVECAKLLLRLASGAMA
jgi:hypothetical protein